MLPDPGYHEGVRELCTRYGTLLLIDETHTISAGPGGCTKAWGLRPDIVTIGKTLGAGIPSAAYGMSQELSDRVVRATDWRNADVGGVGGTLAGNALSLAAMRATLGEVITDEAFDRMVALGERFEEGVEGVIDSRDCRGTSPGSAAASSTCSVRTRRNGAQAAAARTRSSTP